MKAVWCEIRAACSKTYSTRPSNSPRLHGPRTSRLAAKVRDLAFGAFGDEAAAQFDLGAGRRGLNPSHQQASRKRLRRKQPKSAIGPSTCVRRDVIPA